MLDQMMKGKGIDGGGNSGDGGGDSGGIELGTSAVMKLEAEQSARAEKVLSQVKSKEERKEEGKRRRSGSGREVAMALTHQSPPRCSPGVAVPRGRDSGAAGGLGVGGRSLRGDMPRRPCRRQKHTEHHPADSVRIPG